MTENQQLRFTLLAPIMHIPTPTTPEKPSPQPLPPSDMHASSSSPATPEKTSQSSAQPPTTPTKPSNSAPSADAILHKLRNVEGSYYLGDDKLASKCKFLIGNMKEGNTLIVDDKDSDPTEFLLCGAFEIDKRDFFLVSDGNYFPNNNFSSRLCDAKASCRLMPIRRDPAFKFSKDHYATAIANILAIEKLAPCSKKDAITSILHPMSEPGSTAINAIKITHSLFSRELTVHDISPNLFSLMTSKNTLRKPKTHPQLRRMMASISVHLALAFNSDISFLLEIGTSK
jgi:hypothetical protein